MRITGRTLALLVLGSWLCTVPASQAGPKAFLEAVDKAMKEYAADLQAEGESNLNTIKTVGGKLLRPTKWKELPQDIDAGFKAYSGALIKTGDDALANTKAMFKLLLSVRTYIPDFILKIWDSAIAKLKAAGEGVSAEASSAWSDDPAGASAGAPDGDVPDGAPSAPTSTSEDAIPQGALASRTRARRTLSTSERDRLLGRWVEMRSSTASLVKLSRQAKPEGKAKVAAAMDSTLQTVRSHDRTLIRHLALNPKACLEFVKSFDRLDHEQTAAMADVIGQLNRIYVSKARARKVSPELKATVVALGQLKSKLRR